MITKSEIAVLDGLSTGREATPEKLATATGYSRTHLYEVIDELQEGGLLTASRGSHNQLRVAVTGHAVVEAYRRLTSKLGHVAWEDLLSPATLRVCWYLDEPRRVTAIADRLNITRQAVHNALTPLKDRAMLSPDGPEYALSAELKPLWDFARETVLHEHRTRVREVATSATVEWCDPRRVLVRVQDSDDTNALQTDDEWQMTALARFRDYGLQFFLAGEPAFWYAPSEELTPAEVTCHTLVLESGSRRVSYVMLLVEKLRIDEATLTESARWYGLEKEISALYRALEDELETAEDITLRLPSESEFAALKAQYEVQ